MEGSITKQEYATQYFGFHPSAITDSVYTTLFDYSHEAFDVFQAFLCQEYGHVMSEENIQLAADGIFQVVVQKMDEVTNKLEVCLNNEVLVIPKYVVLPEDKIHVTNPVTKDEDEQLDSKIADLKQQILEAKMRRTYLKQKVREQKTVTETLNLQKNKLGKLRTTLKNLQESVSFSVMKALELADYL